MKRRFKAKFERPPIIRYLILFLFFITIINIFINSKEFKNYLLNMLINDSTNKESKILASLKDNLTSPKNIIYSSLNKSVTKNDLSVFKEIIIDDFDYENASSDYIEDDKKNEIKINLPIVYLYNTHQLEEYESNNQIHTIKPNVMIASYMLREKLKEYNIETLVETGNVKETLNKLGMNYNMSYHITEEFARDKLKTYPSIKYMFDIHRDSIDYEKSYIDINSKRYAKVLFLVGFEHTKEENNKGFAEKLSSLLDKYYEGINRGVVYKTVSNENGIYNNNLDAISTLIEVGSKDNNIEEINNTMEAIAFVFNEYLKETSYAN